MSAFTKFITRAPETIFPEGRFQEIRATAPNQGIYNVEATRDLVKNQPAIFAPFAPANTSTAQDWKLGTFRLDVQADGRR